MDIATKTRTNYHYYYEFSDNEQPVIEVLQITSDIFRSGTIGINEIIFVLQGKCEIISDTYPPLTILENESVFFPSGSHFRASSPKNTNIVIVRMDPLQKLYGGAYSVETLYNESQKYAFPEQACKLEINRMMNQYLKMLSEYVKQGINYPALYEIKIKELLLIFDVYYNKKTLCHFFKPVLNNDFIFASSIFEHWEKAKNAKELAELTSYTESAFNKKFKKVFGVTPYKWLNERKSGKILYELMNSDKPIKQIADEYEFNSQQQFNDYCIRNFNQTPGSIRNR